MYPVIAEPLIFAGGSHDAVAVVFPATAVTESGTEGAALIAAAIATSGDGIFPLLAENRKDGFIVSGLGLAAALVVGYISFALGI